MKSIKEVHGTFAEFGVHRGDTFMDILTEAERQNRVAYGFDSFRGMPEPGEHDSGYPAGKFDVGGPERLISRIERAGHPRSSYELIVGYIPASLELAPSDLKIAFSHVDIDHHATTRALLEWLVERTPTGGLMVCDDYFPGKTMLATRGINEFLAGRDDVEIIKMFGRKAALLKVEAK